MRRAAVTRSSKGVALALALAAVIPACGEDNGPLGDVQALVVLQRAARNEGGDIFVYDSYLPGARIVTLSPPTADGVITPICCSQLPALANADISSFDLSFDANVVDGVSTGQMVFSARPTEGDNYGLYVMDLASGNIEQLPTDAARQYVSPIFLPGNKVMFTTTEVVEPGAPQHVDEYERRVTMQLGTMSLDGTNEQLGPRNLSHRVFPTTLSSGRVLFTQWDHLGGMNAGHLMQVNPDMTALREAFGKEGTGPANSYLKAIEIAPGRVVAIATSRDRTLQSGALVDVRMGETYDAGDGVIAADRNMSEANATYRLLTPSVPLGEEPSRNQVGRYYDAYPLNAKDNPDLLVAWADGPVESGTLGAAGLNADFGVYLYDTKHQTRQPILNDTTMWDVQARPLRPRPAPPVIQDSSPDQIAGTATLLGSMNVYDSTIFNFEAGSIYGVRLMEGYSSEEGFPEMFGNVEQEGHIKLGIAPLADDNSWAAVVPANVPVHLQAIDRFGMARGTEPVWTSGRPGEARICGGCHESRSSTTLVQPGLLHAVVQGPVNAMSDVPRANRQSTTYTRDQVRGVPWDLAIQPIFNNNGCVTCHNGVPGPANPTFTLIDNATGQMATFTFDLSGAPMSLSIGGFMIDGFSKSYTSMVGFNMEILDDADITVVAPPGWTPPMMALNYYGSRLRDIMNPVQQYPTQNTSIRYDPSRGDHQGVALSADEHLLLIMAADMGANWYSRENNPMLNQY